MEAATAIKPAPAPARLASLDAYRGFVMFLMMAEALRLSTVAKALPDGSTAKTIWSFLGWHQTHVEWVGCTLHDLIQPSFSFMVGVALPFSLASRSTSGQSPAQMTLHAFGRAFILIALGIFLRSIGRPLTYFTFEDTLSQIGLGYGFLFLLGQRSVRAQWITFGLLLVGYWAAFVWYPLPGDKFDYAGVGVPAGWLKDYGLTGFATHWNKNSNFAWAFDTWFLNLFPRTDWFNYNNGGYSTLSFIPTLGTMILGLIAGGVLRSERPAWAKAKWFLIAGLIGLASGWILNATGICPSVKRIWTPGWTLFSGGWCFLLLAAFYVVLDIRQHKGWAFPLTVIGMNSIAAYCMDHLFTGFIRAMFKTNLGGDAFKNIAGPTYEPFFQGVATLAVLWLILYWMYRQKIFLRI